MVGIVIDRGINCGVGTLCVFFLLPMSQSPKFKADLMVGM